MEAFVLTVTYTIVTYSAYFTRMIAHLTVKSSINNLIII